MHGNKLKTAQSDGAFLKNVLKYQFLRKPLPVVKPTAAKLLFAGGFYDNHTKRRYASLFYLGLKKQLQFNQIANFSSNYFRARIHRIQSKRNERE